MKIRIELADGRFFASKTDAVRHFGAMLKRLGIGDRIDSKTADGADLLALLRRHPEATTKIGCGVRSFFVDLACGDFGGFGTKCFWLERYDGTTTDWSYRTALDAKHRPARERVNLACRAAVREQTSVVFFAAQTNGKLVCAISGQPLPVGRAVVDHAPPWPMWRIVEEFVVREGGWDAVAARLRPTEDGIGGEFFADVDMAERFARWHAEVARLRIVDVVLNAAMGDHRRA